jgi:hypothetical protein
MKQFNELTKEELSNLTEVQIEAYIDLELAKQGIVKGMEINLNFPDYIKPSTLAPEKDFVIYEVSNHTFLNKEDAETFANTLGKLHQITTDYNWDVGIEYRYAKEKRIETPVIEIKKVYSELKYNAIKDQLKQIKKEKEKKEKESNEVNNVVINYEAIDEVKNSIKDKVRSAIYFLEQVKKYSDSYDKYFAITEDKEKALSTIFTVYNIQDEDMKERIKLTINNR